MHTHTHTRERTQSPLAYRQAQSAPKTENQSVKGGYRGGKRCLCGADLKADVETEWQCPFRVALAALVIGIERVGNSWHILNARQTVWSRAVWQSSSSLLTGLIQDIAEKLQKRQLTVCQRWDDDLTMAWGGDNVRLTGPPPPPKKKKKERMPEPNNQPC